MLFNNQIPVLQKRKDLMLIIQEWERSRIYDLMLHNQEWEGPYISDLTLTIQELGVTLCLFYKHKVSLVPKQFLVLPPFDPHMFRFMIRFALCFRVFHSHEWWTFPKYVLRTFLTRFTAFLTCSWKNLARKQLCKVCKIYRGFFILFI